VQIVQYDNARHSDGRSAFDCGNIVFNEFLQRYAAKQQRDLFLSLWILEDKSNGNAIAGYYTLAPANVRQTSSTPDFIKKASKTYPDVPVILLGRLAVDKNYRGRRLGEALVRDALLRSLMAASTQIGGTAMVVDPYEPWLVAKLYAPLGFVPVDDSVPNGRQILPLKTVASALAKPKTN
jgi:predicted GNAT family N-acyltransferase